MTEWQRLRLAFSRHLDPIQKRELRRLIAIRYTLEFLIGVVLLIAIPLIIGDSVIALIALAIATVVFLAILVIWVSR